MKKLLAILVSIFIVVSCAVMTVPSNVRSQDGTFVECCRDTVTFDKLDSVCRSHNVRPTQEELAIMMYYVQYDEDLPNQWTYTKNSDTLFVITGIDGMYIFTKQVK